MTDDHLQGKLECLHYKYLTEGDWTPGHSLHLQKLGTSPTVRLSRRHHSYPHWSLLGWNDHFHSKICKFPRNDFLEKKKGTWRSCKLTYSFRPLSMWTQFSLRSILGFFFIFSPIDFICSKEYSFSASSFSPPSIRGSGRMTHRKIKQLFHEQYQIMDICNVNTSSKWSVGHVLILYQKKKKTGSRSLGNDIVYLHGLLHYAYCILIEEHTEESNRTRLGLMFYVRTVLV